MARSDNMTLSLRILAHANEALRALRSVRAGISTVATASIRMAAVSRAAFRGMTGAIHGALGPLRLLGRAGGIGGALLGALGLRAIKSSAELETLKLRIAAATSSQEQANRVFKDAVDLAGPSPYEPTELAEVAIQLLNIGQYSKAAMTSIGNVGAVMQRPLQDVASILASMETEPLRRLGINLKRDGDQFVFQFRDRMSKVQQLTATGVDDARQKLLSIFDVKYSGAMQRFATAMQGIWSTFTGNVNAAMARFGDGLLPVAKRFVLDLNRRLEDMINSGTLSNWGKRTGDAISNAIDYAAATVAKAQDVLKALQNGGEGKLQQGLAIWASAAAEIFARGVITYLETLKDLFLGIARMFVSTVVAGLLGSDLPYMDKARQSYAARALAGMTPEQAKAAGIPEEFAGDMGKWSGRSALAQRAAEQRRRQFIEQMSPEQVQQLAERGAGQQFMTGLNAAAHAIPNAVHSMTTIVTDVSKRAGAAMNALVPSTGPSIAERVATARWTRENEAFQDKVRSLAANMGLIGYGQKKLGSSMPNLPSAVTTTSAGASLPTAARSAFIGPPGAEARARAFLERHRASGLQGPDGVRRIGGGITGLMRPDNVRRIGGEITGLKRPDNVRRLGSGIVINSLTVRANDTKRLQNELIRRGGSPAMPAGGN